MRSAPLIALLLFLGCAAKHPVPLIVDGRPARPWAQERDAPGGLASITRYSAADSGRISRADVRATYMDFSPPPTTAPDDVVEPPGDFSKGKRFASVYGSALFGDAGKGEMYLLHGSFGYHFADYQSISLDPLGGYVRSGIDDPGGVIGLDAVYRNHFLRARGGNGDDDWTIFFDGGLGLQQASTNFSGERHFNFRIRIGFGASLEINERARAFVGASYQHISDAGIAGGGGGYDGPMLWAGVTFPF
jgi:hypothetical protein